MAKKSTKITAAVSAGGTASVNTAQGLNVTAPEEITLTDIGLTAQQERQWGDTMSLMVWTCPGFRHLFYKLLTNHNGKFACVPTRGVPVAATDGKNILINPDRFFNYDLRERVFITAHEIVHNVYNDVDFLYRCRKSKTVPMSDGTTLPFENGSMQKAMDYRINALLRDSNIGKPPKDALLDDKMGKASDSLFDVYKRVYQDDEANGNHNQPGGFDTVLAPGASTGQNPQASQQNSQQWAVEVKTAQTLEDMKSQGRGMSGALKRMFEQVLNPQIPWTDKIRGIFSRRVGSGAYNWRKADRRHIVRDLYMPSRSGYGAGHVVVWGDTSGSIGDKELCHYMAELTSIMEECKPRRLTICWCDDAIHRVDELEDASDMAKVRYDAAHEGVGGGGGTAVDPVLDWIKELPERPEVFLALTDGYVHIPPTPPDIPTCIWASTAKKPEDFPWGEVVEINVKSFD